MVIIGIGPFLKTMIESIYCKTGSIILKKPNLIELVINYKTLFRINLASKSVL